MNLRRIKHAIMRLTPEEKVISVGGLLVLAGSFMPWHSVIMSYDKKTITENAFTGDLGVIGFIVFLMALLGLLTLLGQNFSIRLPQFGYTKEKILFFLMGESAFLVLITMAIYTKRSLDFTEAELRFGILTVLLGAFFGAFAAFSQMQKIGERNTKAFFEHPEEENEESGEDEMIEKMREVKPTSEKAPALFAEGAPHEDEMIEEIEAMEGGTSPRMEKPEIKNQADFFTREAGIRQGDDN